MVLLQNAPVQGGPLLPLNPAELRHVALIGRLGDLANTGDHGSSDVRSPQVATALAGLRAALPDALITHVDDDGATSAPLRAAQAAGQADVAVVVVGYTADDEGEFVGADTFARPELMALAAPLPEGMTIPSLDPTRDEGSLMGLGMGGDRKSLRLRPLDVEIIRATVAANPRTVVVLVTAGAVITEEWRHQVPALLLSWYAGSEGGHALADVLLGAAEPGGRLPFSVPTEEAHLPAFDSEATQVTYDRWHGQRLLDREGHQAAFPLGFGLSYTQMSIGDLRLSPVQQAAFTAHVTVRNRGARAGKHVVQLYGLTDVADFPRRVLVGFAVAHLQAGASATLSIPGSTRPLQRRAEGAFFLATQEVTIEAATYSGDPAALSAPLQLT